MFEAALAAARALQPDDILEAGSDGSSHSGGSSSGAGAGHALTGAAIPAPVLLNSSGGGGGNIGPLLTCSVNSATGSVELAQLPGALLD